MQKKRKHHVVWRHYLAAWENERGEVARLRDHQILRANSKSLAVEKDFYRLRRLSKRERGILRELIGRMPPDVQESQTALAGLFAGPFLLEQQYSSAKLEDPLFEEGLDALMSNLEENLHAIAEGGAIAWLAALREGDASFLDSDSAYRGFVHFLALQLFRTRDVQERILRAADAKGFSGPNIEALWQVLRHVMAVSMASGIAARRQEFYTLVLEAPAGAELITTSTPIVNTRSVKSLDAPPEEFELYYPVSPCFGFLLGEGSPETSGRRLLGSQDVQEYNDILAARQPRQFFARRAEDLERYRLR